MAMPDCTKDELWTALDDAIAVTQEFENVVEKLAPFGISAEDVKEVIAERLRAHEYQPQSAKGVSYTQGFVEGLITGKKLGGPNGGVDAT